MLKEACRCVMFRVGSPSSAGSSVGDERQRTLVKHNTYYIRSDICRVKHAARSIDLTVKTTQYKGSITLHNLHFLHQTEALLQQTITLYSKMHSQKT